MPSIVEITGFAAPELDIYARLTEGQLLNRHGPDKDVFIAESPKVIERALDMGCVPISMLMEKKHVESQAQEIMQRCGEIPMYAAEFDVLTQLTGFHLTRGMPYTMYQPPLSGPEEICEGARRIAVLENVMNPTNVGAILRSAAVPNMDEALLTFACSNPLYRRTVRVGMETVFQIPWAFPDSRLSWSQKGVGFLQELGFVTAVMALNSGSVNISGPGSVSEERLTVILGTEGDGLATGTIADRDYTARIPMPHDVDSLSTTAVSTVAF